MMNRRNFLRSVIIGSSAILVGEDMLNWKRKYFSGANFSRTDDINRMLKEIYSAARIKYFPDIAPLIENNSHEKWGGKGLYFNIDYNMKPPKMNRSKYLYTVSHESWIPKFDAHGEVK